MAESCIGLYAGTLMSVLRTAGVLGKSARVSWIRSSRSRSGSEAFRASLESPACPHWGNTHTQNIRSYFGVMYVYALNTALYKCRRNSMTCFQPSSVPVCWFSSPSLKG